MQALKSAFQKVAREQECQEDRSKRECGIDEAANSSANVQRKDEHVSDDIKIEIVAHPRFDNGARGDIKQDEIVDEIPAVAIAESNKVGGADTDDDRAVCVQPSGEDGVPIAEPSDIQDGTLDEASPILRPERSQGGGADKENERDVCVQPVGEVGGPIAHASIGVDLQIGEGVRVGVEDDDDEKRAQLAMCAGESGAL